MRNVSSDEQRINCEVNGGNSGGGVVERMKTSLMEKVKLNQTE